MLDLFNRICLLRRNTGNESSAPKTNPQKSMENILVDSVIIALVALCATVPNTMPTTADCWIMFRAFFIAFILQLAVERGLKREK